MKRCTVPLTLLAAFVFAPATKAGSGYVHLADKGLCNHTRGELVFGLQMDCRDGCDKCSRTEGTHWSGDGGGRLAPQECATGTFYLEDSFSGTCRASLWFTANGKSCTLEVSTRYGIFGSSCDKLMSITHGDKHFQITVKDPP